MNFKNVILKFVKFEFSIYAWHSQSASHCAVLHSLVIIMVTDTSAFKSQFDICYYGRPM